MTFPQRGSLEVQVIFQSDEFNDLNLEHFCAKFKKEKNYIQLRKLKTIFEDLVMSSCILKKDALDSKGNRVEGWGIGEKRGNMEYYPPLNWVGIGLKVLDVYSNNVWIGMENQKGEWCVAYHGVGRNYPSITVKKFVGLIIKGGLKAGDGQDHENCRDYYHKGRKVGRGVYCSPFIETAKMFAGESSIDGKLYYTAFMLRVNNNKIRHCEECDISRDKVYWVLNGTPDEIRPYRILYKCFNENEE